MVPAYGLRLLSGRHRLVWTRQSRTLPAVRKAETLRYLFEASRLARTPCGSPSGQSGRLAHELRLLDPPVLLRAPWISSREQGLVISALVRGYRITRRSQLLELLKKSSTVFELDVEHGGVRNRVGHHVLYDEKPGYPAPGILDGFLTSLLGLYDLSAETGDSAVRRLFDQGIDGLKHSLPEWDYRKKWSWYGSRSCLSNPCYHHINRLLLTNLARLTKDPSLVACAERWNPDRLSL